MLNRLRYKSKQFFFLLIKISIVVVAFYFIFRKLATNEQLNLLDFVSFLSENDVFSFKNVTFLIVLSLFNWFFEILKWNYLAQTIQPITFKISMEQSLAALTASLITPSRIGDYGAKALYYSSKDRAKTVILNLLGNVFQMIVTTIFGVVGLAFFIHQFEIRIDYYKLAPFLFFGVIATLLLSYGFLKNPFKIKGVSWQEIKAFLKHSSKILLKTIFLLSLLRYLTFSFQFYVLLQIFGVEISYFNAMILISSMYLLVSIIPMLFVFDVVLKGSIALFLFAFAGVNDLVILCVVTIMWLLNVVFPAIFGSYYVLNFELVKPSKL